MNKLKPVAPANEIAYYMIEHLITVWGYVIVMSKANEYQYRLESKSRLSDPEFRQLISWMTNPWICIPIDPPKIVDMFTEAR